MSLGAHIRKVCNDDRDAVLSVVRAAFYPENVETIVKTLWLDDAITSEFVTELADKIVGYCAFSKITLTPPVGGLALQLSPVAVQPDHQRRGTGTELVEHAMAECRKGGASLIAVLGHPEYYPRFGFTPAHRKNVGWGDRDVGDALQIIDYDDVLTGEPHDIAMHPAFTED